MQKHIVLCTHEYTPDHGGVARYLSGLVAHSETPVAVERLDRTARWFDVCIALWKATAQREQIEEVWCSHIFPIGTACYIISWVRRIPYVVYFHGMDIERVAQHRGWKQWLARRIVARATRVYANSHYTATRVEQVTGRRDVHIQFPKIEPLPQSSSQDSASVRAARGIAQKDVVLLSVARLVRRKGVDRVVRALSRLASSVVLVVIGDGPERSALEQLAKELGVVDRVHWLGAVDDATTYAWYQSADIFVLPPRVLTADIEGFGIVYLEAGWYGLPVIATRTGGIPDAVADGETGYLLPDTEDPAPMVHAIDQLVQDPALRTRMGDRARTRVRQQFVWNERSNRL